MSLTDTINTDFRIHSLGALLEFADDDRFPFSNFSNVTSNLGKLIQKLSVKIVRDLEELVESNEAEEVI